MLKKLMYPKHIISLHYVFTGIMPIKNTVLINTIQSPFMGIFFLIFYWRLQIIPQKGD